MSSGGARRAHERGAGRLSVATFVAAVLVVTVAMPAASQEALEAVEAGPAAPAQWPSTQLAEFSLGGWPNALRVHGGDGPQNSAAAALLSRGSGTFPFGSPDRSGGADAGGLSAAGHWWGLGICPKSVIVVASDLPADAMAASALSDPTGESAEPWLQRVAAADPLFDPVGGFARVDTFAAPILFARAARAGATSLPLAARIAAADLRSGGCNTARQAVIVGGPAAVPTGVETELVSLGYSEVFRVAGRDRYGTAAAVASALGTSGVPQSVDGCVDPGSTGPDSLGFYANSVVEYRSSAGRCELLGRTVVLADGVEGIDAVAAGWWTSWWQVPVLLHDGSGRLPQPTAEALSLLSIDHIVVLGGEARVPAGVVRAAERTAGAAAIRVAGPNRYATSVEMARHFGGWFADETRGGFADALVCVAASSGTGASAVGWADALTAGPWCGAAGASGVAPPTRSIGPVTATVPAVAGRGGTAADRGVPDSAGVAVPVLLVPAQGAPMPPSMARYLSLLFAVPASCAALVGDGAVGDVGDAGAYAGALGSGACPMPGFAVAFGSADVLADETVGRVSSVLSGGLTTADAPVPALVGAETPDGSEAFGISTLRGLPLGEGAYATAMSMSPVYRHRAVLRASSADGSRQSGMPMHVCLPRGSYENARWLVVEASADRSPLAWADLQVAGWYLADADGTLRSRAVGTPSCLTVEVPLASPVLVRAVSAVGRTTRSLRVAAGPQRGMSLSGPIRAAFPQVSGVRSDRPLDIGVSSWDFVTGPADRSAGLAGEQAPVLATKLTVALRRRPSVGEGTDRPAVFTAEWSVRTERGRLTGTARGEALFIAGRWELRGAAVLRGGSWATAALGMPGSPAVADGSGATALADGAAGPVSAAVESLRAGTADGYGAGGFTATITVNGSGNHDDTIAWQAEAFVNTR